MNSLFKYLYCKLSEDTAFQEAVLPHKYQWFLTKTERSGNVLMLLYASVEPQLKNKMKIVI